MVISSSVQSFFMEIREMTKMCNDVMFISVCDSRTTLWKSYMWYELFFIFSRWDLGLATIDLLFTFSTLNEEVLTCLPCL